MSRTIDERVVEMRFDNSQFESNVKTTMSTLEKLKQSLKFTGATKGLEGVSSAAKNLNLSPIGSAVSTVQAKFSALSVVGVTALANLTTAAIAAGTKIASAITIDPIISGFQEYETQIGAIQTILANTESKGTTLDDVTQALDELNLYADKTIYNFTQMTRNIGTFTAAGVDLDKSVTAIKGIANLAAISGSTSNQASVAMYQLSQALATGTVRLQDWNSVVNAGMGGEVFQTALKRTATRLGYDVDALIKKYGSFRESLTEGGWLTAQVLTETLTQLSGAYTKADLIAQGYTESQAQQIVELANTAVDAATKVKTFSQLMETMKESLQSGWAQTWELLIGDFEEAKSFFTSLSDLFGGIITGASDNRNSLLEGALSSDWSKLTKDIEKAGGSVTVFQNKLVEVLRNSGYDIDGLIEKAGSIGAALEQALNKKWFTNKTVADVIDGMAGTADTKGTTKSLEEIQSIVDAIWNGDYGNGADRISALKDLGFSDAQISVLQSLVDKGTEYVVTLDDIAGHFDTTSEKAEKSNEKLGALATTMRALNSEEFGDKSGRELLLESLMNVINAIIAPLRAMKEAWQDIFPPMTSEQLYNIIEGIHGFTEKLKMNQVTLNRVKTVFKGVFAVLDIVRMAFVAVWDAIKPLFGGFGDLGEGLLLQISLFSSWIIGLRDSIKESDFFTAALKGVSEVIQSVADGISKFADKFLNFDLFGNITASAEKASENSGINKFIGLISSLWEAVKGLGSMILTFINDLFGGFSDSIDTGGIEGIFEVIYGLITVIASGGIAKLIFDIIDAGDGLTEVIKGVSETFEGIQNALNAAALMGIAGAIAIFAGALLTLSKIDSDKLDSSLRALSILLVELMASFAIMGKLTGPDEVFETIIFMLGIATAVRILASALESVGDLDWDELAIGIVGIVGLTATVVGAAVVMGKFGGQITSGAIKMLAFAAAIKIMASALIGIAQLSWGEMARGLIGVIGLIAAMTIAMNLLPATGVLGSIGLVIASAALLILGEALEKVSKLSWGEIGRGLVAVAGSLAVLAIGLTAMVASTPGAIALGIASIGLINLAHALKIFASLSLVELGKSILAIAGVLPVLALGLMSLIISWKGAVALLIAATALIALGAAIEYLGSMPWSTLERGITTIGNILDTFSWGLMIMLAAVPGAVALLIAVGALWALLPVIIALQDLNWDGIAAGLTLLAGSFAIIGIAAALLNPLTGAMLKMGIAMALVGVGVAALGLGLIAAGAGLTAISVGIASVMTSLLTVARMIGGLIVAVCEGIIESGPTIAEALITLVEILVEVLVECIPILTDGVLQLIIGLLDSLITYTPTIVEKLFDLVYVILEALVTKISNLDFSVVAKGLAGTGILALLIAGIAAITPMIPTAMTGIIGMTGIAIELMAMLAILGGLAQIPGLTWIINEGGDLLASIGNAIGGFVGSIIGGIGEGITNSMPTIGTNLSNFMTNVQTFLDGVSGITQTHVDGVGNLVNMVLAITGANLVNSFATLISGDGSFETFGEQLVSFGTALKNYSTAVAGIDIEAINASASAADGLVTLAGKIPNTGGLVTFFTGDNDMATFGIQLATFGLAMKNFAANVSGIDIEAVSAATTAADSLVAMANKIPNSGGLLTIFTGDNDMATFSIQLAAFGMAMKSFGTNVSGIDIEAVSAAATAADSLVAMANNIPVTGGLFSIFTGDNDLFMFSSQLSWFGLGMKNFANNVTGIDIEAVSAAATAAGSLVDMANKIPVTGGLFSVFTGDNDMADFGVQLSWFGMGMKSFSNNVSGIDIEAVNAASTAAQTLVDMANAIPVTGGLFSIFTGDNSMSTFALELPAFGSAIKGFNDNVTGINNETITAAATAANELVTMANGIPVTGGLLSVFTGDNDMTDFGESLGNFGTGIKTFSDNVTGIDNEAVTAAISASDSLVAIADKIPESGGLLGVFTGDKSFNTFGVSLGNFGTGLKTFSDNVIGIDSEAVTAAVAAGNEIITMANGIPETGGLISIFTGDNSLALFGTSLGNFGTGLKTFSDNVTGINSEAISTAATAASSLITMADSIPETGGLLSVFTGDNSLAGFGANLGTFGTGLKNFNDNVTGINPETVTAAANAAKTLVEMANLIPETGGLFSFFTGDNSLGAFAENLGEFGTGVSDFYDSVKGIDDTEKLSSVITNVESLVTMVTGFTGIDTSGVSTFTTAISDLADDGIKSFYDDISGIDSTILSTAISNTSSLADMVTNLSGVDTTGVDTFSTALSNLGDAGIDSFISAFDDAHTDIQTAVIGVIGSATTAVIDSLPLFGESGKLTVSNFASGISDNVSFATTAISSMLTSCVSSFNNWYWSFYAAGAYLVMGFSNGISANTWRATAQARAMASAAYEAAKDELDVNSPSKVFTTLGKFIPAGLAKGIDMLTGMVKHSSENLAETSISSTAGVLSRLGSMVESDIDTQPTIRPVIDISDVESKASLINSMFGSTNAGSISVMMNRQLQNGKNDDIVSALDVLGKKLDAFERPTNIVNGITYDNGSEISAAVETLVRAARIERRI